MTLHQICRALFLQRMGRQWPHVGLVLDMIFLMSPRRMGHCRTRGWRIKSFANTKEHEGIDN